MSIQTVDLARTVTPDGGEVTVAFSYDDQTLALTDVTITNTTSGLGSGVVRDPVSGVAVIGPVLAQPGVTHPAFPPYTFAPNPDAGPGALPFLIPFDIQAGYIA